MRRLAPVFVLVVACTGQNSTPYGSCPSSSLCADTTPRCVTFRNRINGLSLPMCTIGCTSSADCPDHGVCVTTETPGLPALCVQNCLQDTDCRPPGPGLFCVEVPPGQHGCVP